MPAEYSVKLGIGLRHFLLGRKRINDNDSARTDPETPHEEGQRRPRSERGPGPAPSPLRPARPLPPTFLRAPPPGRAPARHRHRCAHPVPPLVVTCGAERVALSCVLPRAPGSLELRGGAALQGFARSLPSAVLSPCAACASAGDQGKGECWRELDGTGRVRAPLSRALSGRGRRGHVRAPPPPLRPRGPGCGAEGGADDCGGERIWRGRLDPG